MSRAPTYSQRPDLLASGGSSSMIGMAVRILRRHKTVPSVERLQQDFGMSRATAYRWRKAMRDAGMPQGGDHAMTQRQIDHDAPLPRCRHGHAARHIHDSRCASAGGGHLIECACSDSSKHATFELALAEWRRMHMLRPRAVRPIPPPSPQLPMFAAGRQLHAVGQQPARPLPR